MHFLLFLCEGESFLREKFLVPLPMAGIIADVGAEMIEFSCATNDVFMKISLPDDRTRFSAEEIDPAGDGGFECPNDRSKRLWYCRVE